MPPVSTRRHRAHMPELRGQVRRRTSRLRAGVSAIFVATVERPHGLTPNRFIDALIGGVVALLVSQVLLPRDPVAAVGNAARGLAERLGLALRETAAALEAGDVDRARAALEIARGADVQLGDLADAVEVA